ncbi:MAG: MGMT family protein [Clostridiales bacterium]|nr:MGMT family protein [Clostridia bacterium]MCR4883905.1 MGMT family protein [Clostridiales bacterium]
MSHISFEEVWNLVMRIPEGSVATYGQIAHLVGHPHAARIVGFAMHAAPPQVPCHRVVSSKGGLSDAFQPFGCATHRFLLEIEHIPFTADGCVDLASCLWQPHFQQEGNS